MATEQSYEVILSHDDEDNGFAEIVLTINATTQKKAYAKARRLLKTIGRIDLELSDIPEQE